MLSSRYTRAAVVLGIFSIPLAHAQIDLPQCVENCINASPDTNCALTDVRCICKASSGSFLTDVVTCAHSNCDNNLDTSLFLPPLQLACMIAGAPIPASAIRSAQGQASSLATQVTMTVTQPANGGAAATTTVTQTGSSASGGVVSTTTVASISVSTVTITTTQRGTTQYLIYPITFQSTQTVTGPTSTFTSISTVTPSPSNGFTGVIPVIVVGTNSAGSTYTSTTTQPGAVSTYTTTDSRGSTTTQRSTFTSVTSAQSSLPSSSTGSASSESTSLTTTTVAAAKTSSSRPPQSSTSQAPNPDTTNSAPFKNTNSSPASRLDQTTLWLSVGLIVVFVIQL